MEMKEESFISKLRKVNPEKADQIVAAWNDAIKWVDEMDKSLGYQDKKIKYGEKKWKVKN